MSYREIQPLSFACPHCSSLINLTIENGKGFNFSGAQKNKEKQYGRFDGRNPFVDLHLDFPVWFNDYIPGMTPFMVAMDKIIGSNKNSEQSLAFMQFHTQRLNQLNLLHKKSQQIRTILKLYSGHNKQLFKTRVEQFLSVNLGPSLEPQDINAALYQFVSYVFLPFVHLNRVMNLIENFSGLMLNLAERKESAFNAFIDHIMETNFLHKIQKDCL
ncbi:MAG: hypothetical protein ABL873_08545, partial [Gallionella sp.]